MRPSLEELAQRRAEAIRFLARNPDHTLAPMLRVLVGGLAPPTKEEAIPVMVKHANETGGWPMRDDDTTRARDSLTSVNTQGAWADSIRAQWATLVHFCGGAE